MIDSSVAQPNVITSPGVRYRDFIRGARIAADKKGGQSSDGKSFTNGFSVRLSNGVVMRDTGYVSADIYPVPYYSPYDFSPSLAELMKDSDGLDVSGLSGSFPISPAKASLCGDGTVSVTLNLDELAMQKGKDCGNVLPCSLSSPYSFQDGRSPGFGIVSESFLSKAIASMAVGQMILTGRYEHLKPEEIAGISKGVATLISNGFKRAVDEFPKGVCEGKYQFGPLSEMGLYCESTPSGAKLSVSDSDKLLSSRKGQLKSLTSFLNRRFFPEVVRQGASGSPFAGEITELASTLELGLHYNRRAGSVGVSMISSCDAPPSAIKIAADAYSDPSSIRNLPDPYKARLNKAVETLGIIGVPTDIYAAAAQKIRDGGSRSSRSYNRRQRQLKGAMSQSPARQTPSPQPSSQPKP